MEIGTIKQSDIREEMQGAYLDYAMSVITSRALPDVRDGLKPVQRRILFGMWEMGLRHNSAYKKSARIVGDVLGRYHPHGDQAVYDALVRMAQDFTMRYPLIDGQGNFGCFTGDTKIKLLDGTERSFADLAGLDPEEVFHVYSIDDRGRIVIGEGHNARVTRRNAGLIELTLDNGEKIRCTPDHRFLLRSGEYKQAQDLSSDDSLMPGYFDAVPVKEGLNEYLRVMQPNTGEFEFVHHLADEFNENRGLTQKIKGAFVRHHKNLDRFDNRPTNIERLGFLEHLHLHAEQIDELWKDPEFREKQQRGVQRYYDAHPDVREERRTRFVRQNRDESFRRENAPRTSKGLKQHFQADPDARAEISARMQALWADPDYRTRMAEVLGGIEKRALSPKEKERVARIISEKSRAMWGDDAKRAEIVHAISRAMADPELRQRLSEKARRLWQDPEYRSKYANGHFAKMAQAFWAKADARELHQQKLERQWQDEDFRAAQRDGVKASNARRIEKNPNMMKQLAARARRALTTKWSQPDYQKQVMRSKIARYVHDLLQRYGRDGINEAVYESERGEGWIPHFSRALTYFRDLDEMLDVAASYNHRVVAKRWLTDSADVYDITVDPHHNFLLASGVFVHNSIDNDPAAAMRYTEARLTELAEEMLLDIDKDTVDFRPNFDETMKEPTVLPAKVPNLLLNGTAGIAVGMATLVPPHNLREVVDATNYLIDHWNKVDEIEPDDLMQFVKGPDFPTGGIILGVDGIKEAYATGKGRITVRAKIHTEQVAGGRTRIVVSEIPYQVNKSALIERIAELVRERKIEDIGDLRDESDRQGMSIIVELKRSVEATPVINQLLKHTQLQAGFSLNMLALVDGEPRVLSLKRVLQLYVQHRQIVITRRSQFELERAKMRAHILEGLKIALDHLDEVIRTIRQSPDADTARERLMKRFKLTEIQATAILDMQLRRLAALERKKIEEELAEVHKRIRYLEELLRSPKKILGVVKEELDDLKERFGDARRTFIAASAETEFKEEAHGEEAETLVAVTREGFIRRSGLSQYRRTRKDAEKGVQSREEDPVEHLFVSSTRDNLALLTNRGRAIPLRMSQVPDVTRNPTGYSVKGQLEPDERLIAALPINDAKFIVMATAGGKIKRTGIEEFSNLQSGGTRVLNLGEGDELGWALASQSGGELLLVTAQGQALRFKEEDVPVQGRAAAGVWAIKLAEGDRVVALEPCSADGWLTVTSERGFAKRTAMKDFPVKGRYTSGVGTFPVDARTGPLAAASVVDLEDDVMLMTASGTVLRIRAENIAKGNRGARGKLLLEPKGDDKVTAIACVVGRIEKTAEEPGGTEEPGEQVKTPEAAVPPNGHEAKAEGADGDERRAEKDGRKGESKKPKGKPEPKTRAEPEAKSKAAARAKTESKPRARAGDGKKPKGAEPPAAAESKPAAKKPEPKSESPDKQMELDIPLSSFKPLPKKKK